MKKNCLQILARGMTLFCGSHTQNQEDGFLLERTFFQSHPITARAEVQTSEGFFLSVESVG